MVQYIPPPDYKGLLPPLLACLPTSFVSPRPPPALLPLLTPILRQRVQLLATNASSPTDSWLPLLCWESGPAQKLVDVVSESDAFELHPVSGEIDFGEVEDVQYRRLDEETLQAKIVVTDMGLIVIYLWCVGDPEGGGDGWHASEVRPLEGDENVTSETWWPTMGQADERFQNRMMDDALRHGEENTVTQRPAANVPTVAEEQSDDDDDYWAQYDQTPGGRTPAVKSPGPSTALNTHARTTSEADHYARYAQVQPEMDNDDPSGNRDAIGESTLNGDVIRPSMPQIRQPEWAPIQGSMVLPNGDANAHGDESADLGPSHPTATSPRPRSATVTQLEYSAQSQSVAEIAVKQHISTSIKSLFRLSRNSGIERSDFDRMVRTELETLSMIGDDDC